MNPYRDTPRRPWAETVALAQQILADEPKISGAALGRRLGRSPNVGQLVIRQIRKPPAAPTARFSGPTLSERHPHLMLPVARIELTQGLHAIVDPEDYEFAAQYRWSADKTVMCYAATRIPHPQGGRATHPASGRTYPRTTTLRMHVLIAGGVRVDHVNGDGLDNRRVNLRLATASQNGANARKKAPSSSRFKGVSRRQNGKWMAYINVQGKRLRLGCYIDEADAARAYDRTALAHFGEFAKTNEMLGLYEKTDRGHEGLWAS